MAKKFDDAPPWGLTPLGLKDVFLNSSIDEDTGLLTISGGSGGGNYTFSGIDGITTSLVGRHLTIGNTSSGGSYTLTPQKFLDIGNLTLTSGFNIVEGKLNFLGGFNKLDKSAFGVKEVIPNAITTPTFLVNGMPHSQYIPSGGGNYVLSGAKILAQANTTNFKLTDGKIDINDNVLTDATFSPEPSSGNQFGVYKKENKSYVKVPSGGGSSVTAQDIYNKFKANELIISGLLERKLEINKALYLLASVVGPKPSTTPNLVLNSYIDGGRLKCGVDVTPTNSYKGIPNYGSTVSMDNVDYNWDSNNKSIIAVNVDVLNTLTIAKTRDDSIPTPTYNNLKNWLNEPSHDTYLELTLHNVGNGTTRFQIAKSVGRGVSLLQYHGQDSALNGGLYFSGTIFIYFNQRNATSLNIQNVRLDWGFYFSKSGIQKLVFFRNPNNAAHFSDDLTTNKFDFRLFNVKH